MISLRWAVVACQWSTLVQVANSNRARTQRPRGYWTQMTPSYLLTILQQTQITNQALNKRVTFCMVTFPGPQWKNSSSRNSTAKTKLKNVFCALMVSTYSIKRLRRAAQAKVQRNQRRQEVADPHSSNQRCPKSSVSSTRRDLSALSWGLRGMTHTVSRLCSRTQRNLMSHQKRSGTASKTQTTAQTSWLKSNF